MSCGGELLGHVSLEAFVLPQCPEVIEDHLIWWRLLEQGRNLPICLDVLPQQRVTSWTSLGFSEPEDPCLLVREEGEETQWPPAVHKYEQLDWAIGAVVGTEQDWPWP